MMSHRVTLTTAIVGVSLRRRARRGGAAMRAARAFCLAAALALAAPAFAGSQPEEAGSPVEEVEAFVAAGGVGSLVFPAGPPERRIPVVILLQDAMGSDGRAARYVDQLLGAGFAVLELLVNEEVELHGVVAALAAHPRLREGEVALMGFGAGARLAAQWPGQARARALLYPGCASLAPAAMPNEAVLLMHGDADRLHAHADCDRLAARLESGARVLRWRVLRGAGYGWDQPHFRAERRNLVPAPDGSGRIAATPWPALVALSAAEVAGFFATSFAR